MQQPVAAAALAGVQTAVGAAAQQQPIAAAALAGVLTAAAPSGQLWAREFGSASKQTIGFLNGIISAAGASLSQEESKAVARNRCSKKKGVPPGGSRLLLKKYYIST